jgi:hypothetical protein
MVSGAIVTGHSAVCFHYVSSYIFVLLCRPDNWTAVTVDGRRSAQFEHTLLVTEDGIEILT